MAKSSYINMFFAPESRAPSPKSSWPLGTKSATAVSAKTGDGKATANAQKGPKKPTVMGFSIS